MPATQSSFWQRHPGLVWSNPAADDAVFIRAALVRPRFDRLLDIAVRFGVQRLRNEWGYLDAEPTAEVTRARAVTQRILANIEKGFARAAGKD